MQDEDDDMAAKLRELTAKIEEQSRLLSAVAGERDALKQLAAANAPKPEPVKRRQWHWPWGKQKRELAARLAELEAEARSNWLRHADAEYARRAGEELGALPGTEAEKVAVLRGMDGMDEAGRKAMQNMLKAANGVAKLTFARLGNVGVFDEDFDDRAALNFEKRINEIKTRDDCSATEAMERAALEFPKEYEEWQTGAPCGA